MGITPDYQQLLSSLNTAVMLVDDQLQLVYLNTACENLLRISLNQTHGATLSHLFYESDNALEKALKTLDDNTLYTKRKALWRLHDHNRITVDYTVTPLADTHQILFEIQPLDRLLQISREETLIATQETSRNLVRGLAHEVKNPLGGIRGAAQLLERELAQISDNPDLEEYTHIIISESDRLRNLVDRMLGPRRPIDFKSVNIHEVLERVITLIKAEAGSSVELNRDYDPSIPVIKGDIELLIQAFLNIVRNAKQALDNQQGNDNPTVTLSTQVQRQFTIGHKYYPLVCATTIFDNGPGIPENIIEDIFYPMISGRAEGTGLGLSISQQLINQHNGLIECTSEPGNTRFSIYIPLTQT